MPKFKWIYCNICLCPAVICPKCGNNCCNGTSGENCPDNCDEAYEYQEKAFKDGTIPKKLEVKDC